MVSMKIAKNYRFQVCKTEPLAAYNDAENQVHTTATAHSIQGYQMMTFTDKNIFNVIHYSIQTTYTVLKTAIFKPRIQFENGNCQLEMLPRNHFYII